jgi:hypothetical protein
MPHKFTQITPNVKKCTRNGCHAVIIEEYGFKTGSGLRKPCRNYDRFQYIEKEK